nr:T9SS type A sorting domain-containing protein [Saprospiraceae bacterium]
MSEGILTTSWHRDGSAQSDVLSSLESNPVLFTVVVTSMDDVHLSDVMTISGRYTEDEAYNASAEILDIALEFVGESRAEQFELYQNRPNPFNGETTIGFRLPEAMHAQITVYDVSGRVIRTYEGDYAKGYNQITVDQSQLATKGILYYQLDTEQFTATRRMILIE